MLYKNIAYDNVEFENSEGDHGSNFFTRSEQANVWGWDLTIGKMHFYNLKDNRLQFFINYFCGIGMRYKHRYINTFTSEGYVENFTSTGKIILDQKDLVPVIGLKLGVRIRYE